MNFLRLARFDSSSKEFPREIDRKKIKRKDEACFEEAIREDGGAYERLEFVRKERLEAGDDPPPREKNGPRLIFPSLRGKWNYSSPCSNSFWCNTYHPFYSNLKLL